MIAAVPDERAVASAARGPNDNFVAEVSCGKCSFAWYDGLRYQNLTAVRCPSCQALNRVDSGNIVCSPMPNKPTRRVGSLRRWSGRRRAANRPPIRVMEGHDATWSGPRNTTKQPLNLIMESHHTTEKYSGGGLRRCSTCDTRWTSVLGSYLDAGELAKLKAGRDYEVLANWQDTIGLTCRGCRRSLCMDHVGKPEPAGEVPQAHDYHCPFCGERMAIA